MTRDDLILLKGIIRQRREEAPQPELPKGKTCCQDVRNQMIITPGSYRFYVECRECHTKRPETNTLVKATTAWLKQISEKQTGTPGRRPCCDEADVVMWRDENGDEYLKCQSCGHLEPAYIHGPRSRQIFTPKR